MTTISEDYVSFETAKLLKEKGFDVPCNCYGAYNGVNLTYRLCITDKYTNWNKHTDKTIISCPTLQIARKWLREVHGIEIMIRPYVDGTYSYEILNGFWYIFYDSYEDAAEAAIKYCLENLI